MKEKQKFSIFPFLIMGVFLVFASSCKKDKDNDPAPASNNPTNGKTSAVFNPKVTYGTMTDQDGNVYKTVTIGTQTWMAENLRTTKYNDGTAIPNVSGEIAWKLLSTDAYCNYSNTIKNDSLGTYGRLYNWYAVKTGKLAPKGWHVPSDAEWTQLTTYLGGTSVAGGKLKETGPTHWYTPNTDATNESGFTALPAGQRSTNGVFFLVTTYGYFWTATESSAKSALNRNVSYDNGKVSGFSYDKLMGMSVRCVKD